MVPGKVLSASTVRAASTTLRAAPGKIQRGLLADASAGAGDDHHLAGKIELPLLLHFHPLAAGLSNIGIQYAYFWNSGFGASPMSSGLWA